MASSCSPYSRLFLLLYTMVTTIANHGNHPKYHPEFYMITTVTFLVRVMHIVHFISQKFGV